MASRGPSLPWPGRQKWEELKQQWPEALALGGWALSDSTSKMPGFYLSCQRRSRLTCSLCLLRSRGRAASSTVFSCPRAARRRRYRFLEAGKGVGSPRLHPVPEPSTPRQECKN